MEGITDRFKGAPWYSDEKRDVFVGGSGGIGSWVAFFLSRANFTPYVQDFDTIEPHNLGGQLFFNSDIGISKVHGTANVIKSFTGIDMNYSTTPITTDPDSLVKFPHVFSAFDNMKARKDLFNHWKEDYGTHWDSNPIFIDGRLESEQLQIFCVTPDRIQDYEARLFDDSLVEELPCTLKQTSHVAAIIAGLMTAYYTNFITNCEYGEEIREVPFFFEMCLPFNIVSNE